MFISSKLHKNVYQLEDLQIFSSAVGSTERTQRGIFRHNHYVLYTALFPLHTRGNFCCQLFLQNLEQPENYLSVHCPLLICYSTASAFSYNAAVVCSYLWIAELNDSRWMCWNTKTKWGIFTVMGESEIAELKICQYKWTLNAIFERRATVAMKGIPFLLSLCPFVCRQNCILIIYKIQSIN